MPQLVALGSVTSFLLVATGIAVPSLFVNLRISVHDVRGAIMPPGRGTRAQTRRRSGYRKCSLKPLRVLRAQLRCSSVRG